MAAYVAAGIKPTITRAVKLPSNQKDERETPEINEAIVMKLTVPVGVDTNVLPIVDSYDGDGFCAFESVTGSTSSVLQCENAIQHIDPEPELKVVKLLRDFEEKSKNNEWPATTKVHCYWCCHPFTNAPIGIPTRVVHDKFHVFGCFCSLECSAAYNFASNESMDDIWERYALINLLAHRLSHAPKGVRAAPSRLALSCFGGHLSIEDFRNFAGKHAKFINVNFPPMMTMTLQIEEINDSDVRMEQKYVPIDTDRVNKYKEKVMLRRTKPLLGSQKNTLDSTMNIRCERSTVK